MLALVTGAQGALAQDSTPPPSGDEAAVDQYTEVVPTSDGGRSPGSGKETLNSLPQDVERELETTAGADAPVLKRVATSSKFGAPPRELPRPLRERSLGGGPIAAVEPDGSVGSTASAAVSAFTGDGSQGRLGGLLVVLLLTGAAALAAAVRRQRQGRT